MSFEFEQSVLKLKQQADAATKRLTRNRKLLDTERYAHGLAVLGGFSLYDLLNIYPSNDDERGDQAQFFIDIATAVKEGDLRTLRTNHYVNLQFDAATEKFYGEYGGYMGNSHVTPTQVSLANTAINGVYFSLVTGVVTEEEAFRGLVAMRHAILVPSVPLPSNLINDAI